MFSAYLAVSANHTRLWNMDAKTARAWGLLKQPDKQKPKFANAFNELWRQL
jgi:hypothetical protein